MQSNDTTEYIPKASNVIKLNTAFAAAATDYNKILVFNAVVNGICFQLPLSANEKAMLLLITGRIFYLGTEPITLTNADIRRNLAAENGGIAVRGIDLHKDAVRKTLSALEYRDYIKIDRELSSDRTTEIGAKRIYLNREMILLETRAVMANVSIYEMADRDYVYVAEEGELT